MTIIVTGAAGFIGANIVKGLNERGETDIIAVDNLTRADKFKNIVDCQISDYLDKTDFVERFARGEFGKVRAIFHEGACSDTMETDGRYMMDNNYRYSLAVMRACLDQGVQFLYASSAATYGASETFREEPEFERPLNVYGYSKLLFDQIVRRVMPTALSQIVGSATSTSTARASSTRAAWRLWRSTTSTSSARKVPSSCSASTTATRKAARCAISCRWKMW